MLSSLLKEHQARQVSRKEQQGTTCATQITRLGGRWITSLVYECFVHESFRTELIYAENLPT